jgi:heterodisulfide reductase subunit C
MQSELLESVHGCYQCQKCSSGCPVASFMEIKPHQMMHMMALGMEEKLQRSPAIWLCLSCYTCTTRCPNKVDVAGAIDSLRSSAYKRQVATGERATIQFHESFLRNVKMWGRTHELSVMMLYKLSTKRYLEDLKFGFTMFRKGKIKLIPPFFRARKQVRLMFAGGHRKGDD